MNAQPVFQVPTAAQYVRALQEITIDEAQRKMLKHHFEAHNRTATFTELATAAGYTSYSPANLHYGRLGKDLGERIGITFLPLVEEPDADNFYSSAIGTFTKNYKNSEGTLIMHHELAKALETLGWFRA